MGREDIGGVGEKRIGSKYIAWEKHSKASK